ncbi:MAG: hypothetical protein F7B59_02895 [Desulfurococcales archaeon]|nr:hypothetical protein [Desulfurococcales archaeon]
MPLTRNEKNWVLLYGRRKTGKTFTVKTVRRPGLHLIITRSGKALVVCKSKFETMTIDNAISMAVSKLENNAEVFIDEFQRLPEDYWDALALPHPSGTLVLAASSYGIVEKVYSKRSPLLGLVKPVRIPVINASDAVVSLYPRLSPSEAVYWSVILRDPWITPYAESILESLNPIEFILENHKALAMAVKGLIGEVFSEEDRKLTRLYEEVLKLLGSGYWNPREISHTLYARGLIETPSPGTVTGILDKLESMGLVTKVKLWKTRKGRYYYKHASPLLSILYGLMGKYATDELDIPVKPDWVTELYSTELAFNVGEILAEYYRGVQAYTILPGQEGDIDIVILDEKARYPKACYEVKKDKCSPKELSAAYTRAEKTGCPWLKAVCTEKTGGSSITYSTIVDYAIENVIRAVRRRR